MTADGLTHLRSDGTAHMVDVSGKDVTARSASARGGGTTASAASTAMAKAQACATVLSPESRPANRAATAAGLPSISPMLPLCR